MNFLNGLTSTTSNEPYTLLLPLALIPVFRSNTRNSPLIKYDKITLSTT